MHDPLKVDLISNWKAVFADFFEAVAFVESNSPFVFAEHTDINIGGFSGGELLLGPSHEFLSESLSDELLALGISGENVFVIGRHVAELDLIADIVAQGVLLKSGLQAVEVVKCDVAFLSFLTVAGIAMPLKKGTLGVGKLTGPK